MKHRNVKTGVLERAYSVFQIKEMDEESRVIEGYATTPATDSMDDIVEPKGAEFDLPIPLLWQHKRSEPIGHVIEAKVTDAGIWIKAKFVNVKEPGRLKERLDEAWQSVKYQLVQGLSIGFDPIEYSQIEGSWGLRFLRWKWKELSAVTLAANEECSIEHIKSIDSEMRAAQGQTRRGVVRLDAIKPGATGTSTTNSQKGTPTVKKSYQERIADAQTQRQKAIELMQALVEKSLETGETMSAEDKSKRKELMDNIAELDDHIAMLKETEEVLVNKAPGAKAEEHEDTRENAGQGLQLREGAAVRVVPEKLEKGIAFARFVKCMAVARGNRGEALEVAKHYYPEMKPLHNIIKSAVGAGTTTDANWAGNLVEYQLFAGDFIEYLRPLTIIGRFGTNQNGVAIPGLFPLPFNVEIARQTGGGAAYWVGQGAPKPLTSFAFDRVNLSWAKIATIAVLTDEQIRFSNPAADALVRNALGEAIIAKSDADFLDPSVAAVANVSPASLTNGVTPIAPTGVDADAVRTDIGAIMKKFIDANLSLMNGVWVMSANTAMRLSLMRNALGQKEFPDITMLGGRLEGLPVLTSQHVINTTSGGAVVVLMDAREVYLADDGQVVIDASREASLQMDNAPTNNAATGTGSTMVSMFQTNSVAVKAERYINWAKRRSAGVQYLDGVHWGE
jgi:HK97 family phage major capsid protein/HK97 family phage prohead protease